MGIDKYIVLSLWAPLLFINTSSAQTVTTEVSDAGSSALELVSEDEGGIKLLYKSASYEFKELKGPESRYLRLILPHHSHTSSPGKPQLPVLTRLLDFDRTKNAKITISDVVSTRIRLGEKHGHRRIYPSQPGRTKNQSIQDDSLVIDKYIYNSDRPYKRDTVIISRIGIMRGKSIGRLEINPVIYHPSRQYLDLIISMKIEIEYTADEKPVPASKGSYSYYFDELLAKGLINYDTEDVIPGFSLEPVGMIIVSDSSMKKHLQPLVKWKTRKGFNVTELYIGENGLKKSFKNIKDSLSYIYNNSSAENPAPTYLLLAGDLNYIPSSEGTNYLTDMYYAEFDGEGDFIPDMFTGRLPAKDTIQMKGMVEKIIEYENFLFGDTLTHYRKAAAVTGLDEGYVSHMNGQINYAAGYFNINPHKTISYIFNHENNDSIRNVRYDSLKVLMNEGLGYINYTGHGSATSWMGTGIDHNFPVNMTNGSRYPLVISNACLTGKYDDINCFGSSMVRTPGRGALAFIGCTNDSYWDEDFYWSVGAGAVADNPSYDHTGLGFYDRLFHLNGELPSDWYTTTGQIMFAGNMAVSSSTSPRKQYYWENYILLGDPSISPFIGTAGTISASLPDTLPPSLKILNISTDPFAYVSLSDFDSLWDASHASPSGSAYLDIPVENEKDSCLLVISLQNRKPFFKTIYFAESDSAWLNINDVNVSDLQGNDNGQADYSEQISLKTDVQNAGNGGADDVYLKVSSSSEYLTVISDSLYIGYVAANTEFPETGFNIAVSDSIPDLEIASLSIDLYYNGNRVSQRTDISLHAPEPEIMNCMTDDTLTGNGNGLAEAGERIAVVFRVINNGSSACSGNLVINNSSEHISFDASLIATGILQPGIVTMIEAYADIDINTPEATELQFSAELNCEPYTTKKTLSIIAGTTTDDFELLNFTTFPWIIDSGHPWIITSETAHSNMYSARSAHINHNEESVLGMQLNIPEDDTLRFWYKVSSEADYDFFRFQADSTLIFSESGDKDWTQAVIPLSAGVHLLQWIYKKDGSVNNGNDCAYIDLVRFPENSFIQTAISLNKINSPVAGKNYNEEILTVELSNLGRDTVSEFAMSYIINDNQPVNELFTNELLPGDTVNVSFTQTIDMSSESTYYIRVFLTSPQNYFIDDTLKLTIVSTAIEDTDPDANAFIIAPNPVRDNIRIICSAGSEDNMFTMYNSSGIMIYKKHIEQISAGETISLYPGRLPQGSYILRITSRKDTYTLTFIKASR